MEYYDSINNSDAYQYYLNKNNKMLVDESVLASIDKIKGLNQEPIKLFELKTGCEVSDSSNNLEEENTLNNNDYDNISNLSYELAGRNRNLTVNKKIENSKLKEQAEEIVKAAINCLSEKFRLFANNWVQQIEIQNEEIYNKVEKIKERRKAEEEKLNKNKENIKIEKKGSESPRSNKKRPSNKKISLILAKRNSILDESVAKIGK